MRHARLHAVLGLLFAVAAGCKNPTQMVVYVNADSLVVVGRDFDFVHIKVTGKPDDSPPFFDSPNICVTSTGSGCKRFPVTITLIPGPRDPNATVRVQVDAVRRRPDNSYVPVISDAALFTFTSNQSQRLDFTLYAACLNRAVACAMEDKVCDIRGLCVELLPSGGSGREDMAAPRDLGADGGVSDDMAQPDMTPLDMATPDLMGMGDLSSPDACVPQYNDMGMLIGCLSTF